jgi:5-methylthioribose kinase
MSYAPLNPDTLLDYLRDRPALQSVLPPGTLTATEVGDGNLNLVFIVRGEPGGTLVVKQALPYLRVAGESWPLTRERMRFETEALRLYNELVPGLAPEVYDADEEMSLVVMEHLGLEVMRKSLVARRTFPNFAAHIGTFLATVLFKTSDLYLTGLEKKTLQGRFNNPHLSKIQEDFVFTNPYMASPENRWNPLLDAEVRAVRQNAPLKRALAELKGVYMTRGEALVHSDLHTGSIMVSERETRVIDPEFAFYGPMGYDVGALLSNLMIAYAAHLAHTPDLRARDAYQEYLLGLMRDVWTTFAQTFDTLWATNNHGELAPTPYWDFPGGAEAFAAFRRAYLHRLLQDTAGLGACESLRRTMGIVSVWELASIPDLEARAAAERLVMRVSTRWILERGSFSGVDDLLGVLEEEAGVKGAP